MAKSLPPFEFAEVRLKNSGYLLKHPKGPLLQPLTSLRCHPASGYVGTCITTETLGRSFLLPPRTAGPYPLNALLSRLPRDTSPPPCTACLYLTRAATRVLCPAQFERQPARSTAHSTALPAALRHAFRRPHNHGSTGLGFREPSHSGRTKTAC